MPFDWGDIIENMNVALMAADEQGVIAAVNTSAENLFLISRRFLVGKNLEDIFERQQSLVDVIQRASQTNSRYSVREVEFSYYGGFEADITITPVLNGREKNGVLIEVIRTDRTSRLAQETRNLEQQQSNRLMMRSMSHEIKNPLSGIRGAAQLLSSELANPELQEFTDVIIRESDRLTNLVSRVMGSHKQYESEPVNIHYVIEHVTKVMKASRPDTLLIEKDYDPSLPEIIGDSEQLIQAVMNIVKNAVEIQESSATQLVGIRTRLERNFTIAKKLHRNLIKLQIWDDGKGVPENIKEFIFNPMITGRAEGTGLGLSISQEIIQRHNGLIVLEDYNEQTCFSIYLPIDRQ